MTEWLEWARGPAFRFSIALMLLGLVRLLALNAIHLVLVLVRSQNRDVAWASGLRRTLMWLLPVKTSRPQAGFVFISVVFHLAAIITPIFLLDHIRLWQRGLGVSWWALPQFVADSLTLIAIIGGVFLFLRRLSERTTRVLSHTQDYLLPVLIVIPFVTGYLAMHPGQNPFVYDATMLVHVLSGNLVLILLPFSKLSHAALFPMSQWLSETGWVLSPHAGQRVAAALGKDEQSI